MKRPARLLAGTLMFCFFVWAGARAVDLEHARAGMAGRVSAEQPGFRYQGWTARTWARKAAQARRDANKRQLTIFRLKRVVRAKFIPDYWVAILHCESGFAWSYNGSSGFDGAPQFHPGTWSSYRLPSYPAYAYQASPFQQLVVAELVLARQGWRAWPACSSRLGLR